MVFTAGCGSQGGTLNLKLDNPAATSIPGNNTGTNTGNNTGNTSGKSLMSVWTDATNGYYQLDLSSASFGVASKGTIKIVITNDICSCDVFIQGYENVGTATISNCAGTISIPGYTCSSFNQTGNYYNDKGILTICDAANQCRTMR